MKAYFKQINTTQKQGLTPVILAIVRIADPEKILLLSARCFCVISENIFINEQAKEFLSDSYDLLVLTSQTDKLSLSKQEMLIRLKLSHLRNLHVKLMNIHVFNKAVSAGDEYENFALRNAMIWYNKEVIALADPSYV